MSKPLLPDCKPDASAAHNITGAGLEQDFYNMLMQAPAAIVVFSGPNYVIDFVNDLYVIIAGKSRDELLHKPAFEAMPAAATQGFIELLNGIRATGNPFTLTEHKTTIERGGKMEEAWLNIVYQPLKEINGRINRIMILVTEVTEQVLTRLKKEEEEEFLRQTKNQLELSISIGHIGVWHWDVKQDVLTWSKEQCAIYGIGAGDFSGRIQDFHRFVFPDDLGILKSSAGFEKRTGGDYGYQFRIRRTDGAVRWIQGRSRSFYDKDGNVEYRTGVNIDITERKHAEEALRQSEEKFRSTFDNAAVGIAHVSLDGTWLLVNDRLCNIVGYTKDELLASTFQHITHPDDLEADLQLVKDVLAGKIANYSLEKRYIHKAGGIVWINVTVSLMRTHEGTPAYFISVVEDIHERKRAEEKIAESERRFRTLAEALPEMVWMMNADGKRDYASHKWQEYSGIEDMDEAWKAMVHPGDWASVNKAWQNHFSVGRPFRYEVRLKNKAGEFRWHHSVAEPVKDDTGRITKWIGTLSDVHVQKTFAERLEQEVAERTRELQQKNSELADARSFLQQLIDSSVEFIVVVDRSLNIITVNKRFEKAMQVSSQDVKGIRLTVVNPALKNSYQEECIAIALSGETVYLDKRQALSRPGLFVDTYFIPLSLQGEVKGVIIMSRDVTEIVRSEVLLEEKNRELERSNEDLQQFAHVASHDLKEPIRKVRTFGSRLEEEYGHLLPEKGRLYLSKMQSSAERMFGLIDGVLNYSIINSLEGAAETVNLNQIFANIENDLEVLLQETGGKILKNDLPTVPGSPVLLNQLFYNLLNNALKFSKPATAPLVVVEATATTGKEHGLSMDADEKKTFAQIRICDNGIGFKSEQAEKIFKTFTRLNSRDRYEGTGLGLALCKKIAERHGGYIYATGKEGEGACFYVLLPV